MEPKTWNPFAHSLRELGPFEPFPHLAVAVSGGSDSMALALLADRHTRDHGGCITALTVDHGLRPESKNEAEQVATWMKARNIAHVILTPRHDDAGNNLMNAARQWRYDALSAWCKEHFVLHCLIAHHAADQHETIALHTARGKTEDGPSGMRRVRNYRGTRFLRPLLSFEKKTLQDFLRSESQVWIEDPTNRDMRFVRARLRDACSPLLPPTANDGNDRSAREMEVSRAAVQCITIDPTGFATLDLASWRKLPISIATQLLADTIRTIGCEATRPRKHKTLQLAEALRSEAKVKRTLGGCRVHGQENSGRIEPEKQCVSLPFAPPKPLAAGPFW